MVQKSLVKPNNYCDSYILSLYHTVWANNHPHFWGAFLHGCKRTSVYADPLQNVLQLFWSFAMHYTVQGYGDSWSCVNSTNFNEEDDMVEWIFFNSSQICANFALVRRNRRSELQKMDYGHLEEFLLVFVGAMMRQIREKMTLAKRD